MPTLKTEKSAMSIKLFPEIIFYIGWNSISTGVPISAWRNPISEKLSDDWFNNCGIVYVFARVNTPAITNQLIEDVELC